MILDHVPTHHVHISTGFAFVVALFIVAIVGLVVWGVVASRRPKVTIGSGNVFADIGLPEADRLQSEADARCSREQQISGRSAFASARYAPAPAAPVVVATSGNDGFLTGMLMGEMLADRHHDTVVVHDALAYAPQPSDAGFAWDSGASYDSGSSCSDSGSSGGFDVSW